MTHNTKLLRNALALAAVAATGSLANATTVYGSTEMDAVVASANALQPVVITLAVAFLVFRIGRKFLAKI